MINYNLFLSFTKKTTAPMMAAINMKAPAKLGPRAIPVIYSVVN